MSLQLVPKQPTILVTLGVMAQYEGDLPAAVQHYAQAIALQPTDVGYLLLARALRHEGATTRPKRRSSAPPASPVISPRLKSRPNRSSAENDMTASRRLSPGKALDNEC